MTDSEQSDTPSPLLDLAKQLEKEHWLELLEDRDGASTLAVELPKSLAAEKVAMYGSPERQIWELFGAHYMRRRRWYDALAMYSSMYEHFLQHQLEAGERIHKGMPLVWIADCYLAIANIPLSKRFLMLTLIEDAISGKGKIDPTPTGSYFRLAWRHGLSTVEFERYAMEANSIAEGEPTESWFPEYVLQGLDTNWLVEVPSPNDAGIYVANTSYIQHLISQLGEPTGKVLERLGEYLLACIPGCRTTRRGRSGSTDYDIICSFEGPALDFRSDIGRYFICECKDWEKPADFTAFAKFARVLDSIKASFGVLFSSAGITGENHTKGARLEQIKVFQDRGMVIVVVSQDDLNLLSEGANFVSMLRSKYETVRLDLRG